MNVYQFMQELVSNYYFFSFAIICFFVSFLLTFTMKKWLVVIFSLPGFIYASFIKDDGAILFIVLLIFDILTFYKIKKLEKGKK